MGIPLGQLPSNAPVSTSGLFFDTQTLRGISDTWVDATHTGIVYRDTAKTLPLALTYTPTQNAWWEIDINISNFQTTTAAWNYAWVYQECSPAPVNPQVSLKYCVIAWGHSTGDTSVGRVASHLWRLAANTTYTVTVKTWIAAGNTWQYYNGPGQMWINGFAWAR